MSNQPTPTVIMLGEDFEVASGHFLGGVKTNGLITGQLLHLLKQRGKRGMSYIEIRIAWVVGAIVR